MNFNYLPSEQALDKQMKTTKVQGRTQIDASKNQGGRLAALIN